MLYDFGTFRVDTNDRQLWRDGDRQSLTPKAFDLLVVFLESRGRLLRKQELIDHVWPETFVEESNLAQHVAVLRKALGDSSECHEYIVTVPKQGYRFICPVSSPHAGSAQPLPRALRRRPLWRVAILSIAGSALIGGIGARLLLVREADHTPVPVTSLPGIEIHASPSPDGTQLAFGALAEVGAAPHIYIGNFSGDTTPFRLTPEEFSDCHPAWSPDAASIAFIRNPGENGEVHVMPRQGGASRKVTNTTGQMVAWWPGSKAIIVSDPESPGKPSSLMRVDLASGVRTAITRPADGVGDMDAAVSPDGRRLAVVRWTSAAAYQILVLRVDTAESRVVVTNSKPIYGLTWSPRGDEIIYSSARDNAPKLWRISATATPANEPTRIGNIEASAIFPAALRVPGSDRVRIVYSESREDAGIRLWKLPPTDGYQAPRVAPSTRVDMDPAITPAGDSVAFSSDRSGTYQIWVVRSDGANLHQVTHFPAGSAGSPRWSSDGQRIAFDYELNGVSSIYTVTAGGGGLARIDTGSYQAARPSWSSDGGTIYFQCKSQEAREICRIPVTGGPTVALTRSGGAEAFESRDGTQVYFVKAVDRPGLWRMPVTGGEATFVHDGVWPGYWGLTNNAVYFLGMTSNFKPTALETIGLSGGAARTVMPVRHSVIPLTPGLSITADGRTMLLLQVDRRDCDIMMIDQVR